MIKVILPFSEKIFPESAFAFASKLNALEPLQLAGIFLPEIVMTLNNDLSGWGKLKMPMLIPVNQPPTKAARKTITRFIDACKEHEMSYSIHEAESPNASAQLIKESRFADLIILTRSNFSTDDSINDTYLKDLLHNLECPVLFIPDKCNFPLQLVLAYDGSESSIFAIKQFTYLFPSLSKTKTLLTYADNSGEKEIPDKQWIEELVKRHYSDLTALSLDIERLQFDSWLKNIEAPLLITGAFKRSEVSQLFKKSFVTDMIQNQTAPLFIAH